VGKENEKLKKEVNERNKTSRSHEVKEWRMIVFYETFWQLFGRMSVGRENLEGRQTEIE
jgi:hypothetical protein